MKWVVATSWQLRGLCCNYGVYVAVTGSYVAITGVYVAITGSMWLLRGLCCNYGVGVYVAIMRSMWLLRGLCGCYGIYVAITGSMWLLRGLCGCCGVYVAVARSLWCLVEGYHVNPVTATLILRGTAVREVASTALQSVIKHNLSITRRIHMYVI